MPAYTKFHAIQAFRGSDLSVVAGANEGDVLGLGEDLVMDDIIMLRPGAEPERLSLRRDPYGTLRLRQESALAAPPARICIDSLLIVMAPDGGVVEVLLLDQPGTANQDRQVFAWPLGPLEQTTEYRLIAIERDHGALRLAQLACASFARGTRITVGSGRQRRVETLVPGDEVLTRDDGVQRLRWTGQSSERAAGPFAPVRIAAGALNTQRDLVISADHRLFLYRQAGGLGPDHGEGLVKARDLVNGTSVTVEQGGMVDYVQLLFDQPQMIYAEGIAAETMVVDGWTSALVPPEFAENWTESARPRHSDETPFRGRFEAAPMLRGAAGR